MTFISCATTEPIGLTLHHPDLRVRPPTLQLEAHKPLKPPPKRVVKQLGLQMLASQSAWPSEFLHDLDWFCSVITMAPPPVMAADNKRSRGLGLCWCEGVPACFFAFPKIQLDVRSGDGSARKLQSSLARNLTRRRRA